MLSAALAWTTPQRPPVASAVGSCSALRAHNTSQPLAEFSSRNFASRPLSDANLRPPASRRATAVACAASPTAEPANSNAPSSSSAARLTVASLHRYPVKSCAGERLAAATLTEEGLDGDRRYLVTSAGGMYQTQRVQPKLATVQASASATTLTLRAPGVEPLNVSAAAIAAATTTATLFADKVSLRDAGGAAAKWFSNVLGSGGSLLPLLGLPTFKLLAAGPRRTGRPGGLSDLAPILLICDASLVALNARRLAASLPPVPMDRFRPNVVVSGCAPFEEDTWCVINFGAQATQLITEYPCPRCTVPNVDQATGTVDPPAVSPMRTLRDFRVRGGAVNFGVYLRPTGDLGTLKVGDGLTVQPC